MSLSASARAVQTVLDTLGKEGGFDRLLHRVKILTAGNGSLTALMTVETEDANRGGFLHGGMSALLVDGLSTSAMMTHPKCQSPGVSVNIHMSYLSAAPVGQEILIKASTEKIGKRLAFLSVEIFNKSTTQIIATGSHTKFVGG